MRQDLFVSDISIEHSKLTRLIAAKYYLTCHFGALGNQPFEMRGQHQQMMQLQAH